MKVIMEVIKMKNNKLLIATSLIALLTTGTVGTISTTQNILANDKESAQTTQKAPEKPGMVEKVPQVNLEKVALEEVEQ